MSDSDYNRAAQMLHLKSASHGKDAGRFLVIKRKIDFKYLIEELINSSDGETPKYRVIRPTLE